MLNLLLLRNSWACLILAVLSACGSAVTRVNLQDPSTAAAQALAKPQVLVITLSGKLGTTELARCHRSIRDAEAHGCSYVIFRLDGAGSQGEDPSDLQGLFDRVQSTAVHTVAVLGGRVTQGGAALALVATSAYCLKGASWGEITKPEKEIATLLADDPQDAQNRRLDAVRAMMKGRLDLRRNKLRPDAVKLALAMADPRVQLISATVREGGIERQRILDQVELAALQNSGATIIGESPLPRPLMVTAAEAEEFGLTSGTLQGYGQLLEWLNIDQDVVGELSVNWAEKMVGWLELLQPFLLLAGFVLLTVEIKTPGTGVPGLFGVVFLALALFHSYLIGLAEITEILVFFLGLAAIAVEIFVLPGTIVFGVVGFLCLILALVLSRQSFVLPSNAIEDDILLTNLVNLTLLFVFVLVASALLWRILPKVPLVNRMFLNPPGPGGEPASNSVASGLGLKQQRLVQLVGRTGVAGSVLRPSGNMELDGDRIDVVTEGEFVNKGDAIRVLYVQGSRVVVALEAESPETAGGESASSGPDSSGPDSSDPRASERGSVGLVVLLAVVGLTLIVAEVMLVSMGLLGILAAGTLLAAIFVAFNVSTGFGIAMALIEAIAAPVVFIWSFKILPHTPFGKRLILSGPPTDGSAAAGDATLKDLVGKSGITISPLRPAGHARIDGARVDVVTRGDMLPKDCAIVVIEATGNSVVVGRKPNA